MEEEIRRGLDIGDFANLRGEGRADREIVVADLLSEIQRFKHAEFGNFHNITRVFGV